MIHYINNRSLTICLLNSSFLLSWRPLKPSSTVVLDLQSLLAQTQWVPKVSKTSLKHIIIGNSKIHWAIHCAYFLYYPMVPNWIDLSHCVSIHLQQLMSAIDFQFPNSVDVCYMFNALLPQKNILHYTLMENMSWKSFQYMDFYFGSYTYS